MREYKIGEIFKYNSEWYQCVEDSLNSCVNCCFYNGGNKKCSDEVGECFAGCIGDNCSVCFKKLKKVGESYTYNGIVVQKYKLETNQITIPGNLYTYFDGIENTIEIEIKQTKEDMEMKKVFMNGDDRDYLLDRLEDILHDNHCLEYKDEICNSLCKYITSNNRELKPFNLEAAKAGKPVYTRDGRKARIVCFDRIDAKPILALVPSTDGKGEDVFDYFINGKRIASALESDLDLMMLVKKKEGWVNISNCPDNGYSNYDSGVIVFKTREEAVNFTNNKDYIDTVKVTWEE